MRRDIGGIIVRLPPGSEIAVRDVEAAYRSIPLHPSQWAGAVVRVGADEFAVDTCAMFGEAASGGQYSELADAGADIMRARGIGPISHWVDDHIFFRIRRRYLDRYNAKRAGARARIQAREGDQPRRRRGRIWWEGGDLPEGGTEDFVEDMRSEIKDLAAPDRSAHDAEFTYCFEDIDAVTAPLGIEWGASKDKPFAPRNVAMGLLWDVQNGTVAIPEEKRARYLASIREWRSSRTHTLEEAEKLHGRLQHITYVVPRGRAYLGALQAFMGLYRNERHPRQQPLTPPRRLPADLDWWERQLNEHGITRAIPRPIDVGEVGAYSDASSGVGISVVIGERWRAWRLLPGWKSDGRDIGWAEAIGFEFLCEYVFDGAPPGTHVRIWGDNTGVVEGWWRGRHRNEHVNDVFRRIADRCHDNQCGAITRYVASAQNPADDPSRGRYGPGTPYTWGRLLPAIRIPDARWIVNFDAERTQSELDAINRGALAPEPKCIIASDRRSRRDVNADLEWDSTQPAEMLPRDTSE
jgi:hypothetical protein